MNQSCRVKIILHYVFYMNSPDDDDDTKQHYKTKTIQI
jgi:hypothetical protein